MPTIDQTELGFLYPIETVIPETEKPEPETKKKTEMKKYHEPESNKPELKKSTEMKKSSEIENLAETEKNKSKKCERLAVWNQHEPRVMRKSLGTLEQYVPGRYVSEWARTKRWQRIKGCRNGGTFTSSS